jgi:hypothetical protein
MAMIVLEFIGLTITSLFEFGTKVNFGKELRRYQTFQASRKIKN